MDKFRATGLTIFQQSSKLTLPLTILSSGLLVLLATPALAHHAMGGKMPTNFFEGFLAGLAHPIIGPDHFAFVIAVGLLAATMRSGIMLPIVFLIAAMAGTMAHLASWSMPGVELFVSGSVLLFGLLLVKQSSLSLPSVLGLGAIAGLFHGYAYGEAIFGAQMTPLVAYLAGFTLIQLVISLTTFWIAQKTLSSDRVGESLIRFRSAGLVITGVGLAFFLSQVVAVLFPVARV